MLSSIMSMFAMADVPGLALKVNLMGGKSNPETDIANLVLIIFLNQFNE